MARACADRLPCIGCSGASDLQPARTIYLGYFGLAGQLVGILLWPAVALHVLLSILLGRVWLTMGGK